MSGTSGERETVSAAARYEDSDYVYLMRHGRHDDGRLRAEAITAVRGVGARLGDWLAACPGDVEVACASGREVNATMWRLVSSARDALTDRAAATGGCKVAEPATEFRPASPPSGGEREVGRSRHRESDWPTADAEGWTPAGATADVSWSGLTLRARLPADEVGLGPYEPCEQAIGPIRTWLCGPRDQADVPRRLFVGNAPLVDWLAADLTSSWGVRRDLALGHGELVCLQRRTSHVDRDKEPAFGPRYRVLWTAASHDGDELEPILAKVRSKMSTAGSLGAVLTALLVFLLKDGSEPMSWWSWGALLAFLVATMLYFVTLFFYDTLSMPSRFWASGRTPSRDGGIRLWRRLRFGRARLLRPPTSNARMIQDAMVHVWTWLFLPATVLGGLGVVLLIGDLAWGPADHAPGRPIPLGTGLSALGGCLAVLVAYCAAHRPNLGATD